MRKKMAKLKTGDPAPAFEAVDQDGNMKTLADYRGRKLILYFYPKDNTPGCTAEACSLRDGRDTLRRMGFEVVGVSPDSEKSHQGFIAKQGLNFTLLADTDKKIAEAYGISTLELAERNPGVKESLWEGRSWGFCGRRS
mgnify:CR=1 FL=1